MSIKNALLLLCPLLLLLTGCSSLSVTNPNSGFSQGVNKTVTSTPTLGTSPTATATPSTKATPAPVETPTEAPEEDTPGLAAAVEKSIKENLGIDNFTDNLQYDPEALWGYISSIKDDGKGKVLITVQVTMNETDQNEVQELAQHALSLGKYSNPQLEMVEVITADNSYYAWAA
jgi:hypothetical protein